MKVTSDLTFSVAVPGRSPATGRVSAEGPHLTVETTDPVAVWDGALGTATAGGQAVRLIAGQLAEQGLTVSLSGPKGRVASVGAGVDSLVGRLAAGSRQVSLGRPAAIAPLARARLQSLSASHRRLLVAGSTVAVASLIALARYSRGEHPHH